MFDPAGTNVPSGKTSSAITCFESSGTDGYNLRVSDKAALRYVNRSISSNSNGSSTHFAVLSPRDSIKTEQSSIRIFSSTLGFSVTNQKNQLSATDEVSRPARMKFRATSWRNLSVYDSFFFINLDNKFGF